MSARRVLGFLSLQKTVKESLTVYADLCGLGAGTSISVKDLANFFGKGKEMARTEIVKSLWDYIKEHDLQNPENNAKNAKT